MGIFDFIFGKTIKINDDFFGEMRYMKNKKEPSQNYFECERFFQPLNNKIDIGIEGDLDGPTQKQKDFFLKIEKGYNGYIRNIAPLIEEEFRNWKEDFVIKDFQEEFKAVYLWIPKCDTKPLMWEIAFDSKHYLDHTFTATMMDDEAKEVMIDG